MPTLEEDTTVDHLEAALEGCEGNEEARYHIRSALQHLVTQE